MAASRGGSQRTRVEFSAPAVGGEPPVTLVRAECPPPSPMGDALLAALVERGRRPPDDDVDALLVTLPE